MSTHARTTATLCAGFLIAGASAAAPTPLQPAIQTQIPAQLALPANPRLFDLNAPRIDSVVMQRGGKATPQVVNVIPGGTSATLTLLNLPPNSRVRVAFNASSDPALRSKLEQTVSTRCRGSLGGGTQEFQTANTTGRATITLSLRHLLPAGSDLTGETGPCSGFLAFEVAGAGSDPSQFLVLALPSYDLPQWTVYRYENTWNLRRYFDFYMKADGVSLCNGVSPGLTSYKVGPHERNGDLTIQIRSGPAGTICRAVSSGIAVAKDVKLTAINWAVESDGNKCCVGDQCMARLGVSTVIVPGHLPEDVPERYQHSTNQGSVSTQLGFTPVPLKPGETLLGLAHAWMACDATALNDHGIRLILKSATFEGPPGADMP